MQIFFIIIVSLAIIAGSLYLNKFFNRLFEFFDKKKPLAFNIVFIIIVIVLLIATVINALGAQMIVFGYFLVFSAIFDLIGLIYKKWFLKSKVVKYIYSGGIPAIFLTAIIMIYGFINAYNVVETDYQIKTIKELPNDNIKIAFLSDLHVGVSITSENIEKYCNEIESKKPDVVLLGGDLFDENTTKQDIEVACEAIGDIDSTYGAYFAWGNHEGKVNVVDGGKEANVNFVLDTIIKNDINILNDESILIDDSFYIVGRSDTDAVEGHKSADELIGPLDKDKPIIVMEHKPVDSVNVANAGGDIYLAGHTHAGQVPPLGFFESFVYDLNYGIKTIDDCTMIVSSGLGTWNFPIRIASPSEYVIIDYTE